MNSVKRFGALRAEIPQNVKIVAVSKTKPASEIEELFSQSGHKAFGENKAQELYAKYKILPTQIEWHFIGHLQTNKIKLISPYISMIQSVDSFRLLMEINKEAIKCNRIIPCLLQFHIASEEAKYGFSIIEAKEMLDNNLFQGLKSISVKGIMGMATFTDDRKQISSEFKTLHAYYDLLKSMYFSRQPDFCEISMGMTDDYPIAIEEGSTIIRIGSGIFGERSFNAKEDH